MATSNLINLINVACDSTAKLKEDERSTLIATCERLKLKLETPRESAFRIVFAVSFFSFQIRACAYNIGSHRLSYIDYTYSKTCILSSSLLVSAKT
jgi:hypothetical protein